MAFYAPRYRYPLSRGYRRARYPYPYRYRRNSGGGALPYVVAAAVLAGAAGAGAKAAVHGHHAAPKAAPAPAAGTAAQAIAFARKQLGKPYLWGGTGPGAYDCSGLMLMAYQSAGVTIPRTSQAQWAGLPHVPAGKVVPGDLVFFAGSDGTPASPGHVGLVTGKNTMIEAYATGTPIRVTVFGTPRSPAGDETVTGFAAPAPASPVTDAAPGPGEAGFITAVLTDLGAPDTGANQSSMAAWGRREWPSWPPGARNNPWNTTLTAPGSGAYNYLPGGGSVQDYPSPAEGASATARTLLGGYPLIVSALRSGSGVCGYSFTAEFSEWSGGGYQEVC